ncbi:MAG: PhzF family phenazine biosynthesis protein [Pseudomonadota bacterium]
MEYQYFICDVFTNERFGGNPLAVLPDARGLDTSQMQKIAREFNFSESTFVFPPERGGHKQVRIFTPTVEVPFAGHPNVGTAFVLAHARVFGEVQSSEQVVFEEQAGDVPITIEQRQEGFWCELRAPEPLSLADPVSPELVARVLSLSKADIETTNHEPRVASVGLPFLMVELSSRQALESARVNATAMDELVAQGITPDVHLYVRSDDEFDIRARMFAPLDGVPEDPATGSANCALAGLLTQCADASDGQFSWRIAQGVEMGRPSYLDARTIRSGGQVEAVFIAGYSVLVSQGMLFLD